MLNSTKFRKYYWGNFTFLILNMDVLTIWALLFWIWTRTEGFIFLFFSLSIFILHIVYIVNSLLSVIEISDEKILCKTLFGKRLIETNKIKTIGIYGYDTFGRTWSRIDNNKYNQIFFGIKQIYISEIEDYFPTNILKKDFIDFHFRKQIFELLQNKASLR